MIARPMVRLETSTSSNMRLIAHRPHKVTIRPARYIGRDAGGFSSSSAANGRGGGTNSRVTLCKVAILRYLRLKLVVLRALDYERRGVYRIKPLHQLLHTVGRRRSGLPSESARIRVKHHRLSPAKRVVGYSLRQLLVRPAGKYYQCRAGGEAAHPAHEGVAE